MNPVNHPVSETHIPALDGLRGLAILLVALSHFAIVLSPAVPAEHFVRNVLAFGWCGVDLFFVLSGFLITGILLGTRNTKGYFRKFYMRRVLRIFPLYFAFLAFVFLLVPALLRPNPVLGVNAEWYVLYLQNWKANYGASDPFLGHFWSLAVEEQFYLIWPAIVLSLRSTSLARLCGGLAVAALLCRIGLAFAGTNVEAIYRTTLCRLDPLVLGALVAIAVRNSEWRQWLAGGRRLTLLLVVAAATVGATCAAVGPLWQAPLQHTIGMSGLAVLFAAVVFWTSQHKSSAGRRWLAYAPLRSIGKYSYGIYVFHMLPNRIAYEPVSNLLAGLPPGIALLLKALYMVAMFLLVYSLAFVSYQLFERRFLHLKRHFSYAASRRTTPAQLVKAQEPLEGVLP